MDSHPCHALICHTVLAIGSLVITLSLGWWLYPRSCGVSTLRLVGLLTGKPTRDGLLLF